MHLMLEYSVFVNPRTLKGIYNIPIGIRLAVTTVVPNWSRLDMITYYLVDRSETRV